VVGALLRDVAKAKRTRLPREVGLRLEVRPMCAGETFTVGALGPRGFSAKSAEQHLW
jgi:hypothetical protein